MKKWMKMALLVVMTIAMLCGCGSVGGESAQERKKAYCVVSEREYDADGVNFRLTEYTYDEKGNMLSEATDLGYYAEYDPVLDYYEYKYTQVDGEYDKGYGCEYGYDENNNLNAIRYFDGDYRFWYIYDEQGLPVAKGVEGNSDPSMEYKYDNRGRLTQQTLKLSVICERRNYSYTSDGLLKSLDYETCPTDRLQEQEWNLIRRYLFEYDREGNLIELKCVHEGGEESLLCEFEYDDGRLEKKTCYQSGEQISTKYRYDKNGNIAEAKITEGDVTKTIEYEYEELDLSRKEREDYFRRNTWRWYMELVNLDYYTIWKN